MLRKALFCLILVPALALPCAMAEDSFSILDFYAANKLDQLLTQPGDSLTQHGNEYDADGECLNDYYHYLWLDENGELQYAYQDTHCTELCTGSCSYGYAFEADTPYVVAYLGDAYAAAMAVRWDAMPLQLSGDYEHDDELITSNEVKDNVRTIALSGPFTLSDGSEGTLQSVQSMEVDTLHILSDSGTFYDKDGNITLVRTASYTLNADRYTIDERIIAAQNATDTRTVTFVLDPGTDQETTQVFTPPVNAPVYVELPEGYALYSDAECTTAPQSAEPDAAGNYPAETIFYAAPAAE